MQEPGKAMNEHNTSIWARKEGQAPGTLIHHGPARVQETTIQWVEYTGRSLSERTFREGDPLPEPSSERMTWVHIEGVHHVPTIQAVGQVFGCHPMMLEDIVNVGQRPKVEEYDNGVFFVTRIVEIGNEGKMIPNQVAIVIGNGFVLSFSEIPCEPFAAIQRRLHESRVRFGSLGSGYMGYALIDTLTDRHLSVLEQFSTELDELEEQIEECPQMDQTPEIQTCKRNLLTIRRIIQPTREAISRLKRILMERFNPKLDLYLNDLYDHIVYAQEVTEAHREFVASLQDAYLNSINLRMTKIMGVLTLFSTIFIPLTFLAGIYGMNFSYMPELQWKYGYPVLMGIMLVIGLTLGTYFYRKRWF